MDSTVLRRSWLLLSILAIFVDGKIDNYHSYSYNPKFKSTKPPSISPYDAKPFTPSKAAYFAGTFSSFSEPLNWKKASTSNKVAVPSNPKSRKPPVNFPIPPVDDSFGREPATSLSNDIHPPSIAPPKYQLNHDTEFDGQVKPSLGVNGFSQGAQREPTAVDFGFLPVFPWPEKVPKKVHHLFPKSGDNEMGWRVPQVDNRLSNFPSPVRSQQQVTTTTVPPSTTTQNNDHIWNPRMLTDLPTFPTLIQNTQANFQVQFERVTTPLPPTKSSSTNPPTTTSNSNTSEKVTSGAKSQRNARTVKNNSWSQLPRKSKPSFVLKDEKKFYSPRPGKSDFKRIQGAPTQSSNKQYTSFKCRALDPFTDAVPHPHTDPSCEQGFPGWQKDPNCRCTFLVASRNILGCATKFHTLCWRV